MKALTILALFTLSFNLQAKEVVCSAKDIELIGHYGYGLKSPLLKIWSESSGNLNVIEFNSKEKFSKIKLVFKKDDVSNGLDPEEFNLDNNRTSDFSLIKIIAFLSARPDKMIVELYKDKKIFCADEVIIIERDGQDGVLKKL